MEKFFDSVLKFMAAICAILFVLTVGMALLLFNAEKRLFNAQLYLRALENQNFYDRLPTLAAETLAVAPDTNTKQNSARAFLNAVPPENWEGVFRAILPADISQPLTEQAITSVLDYLNGKTETATLSLTEFKLHLTGPAGTEALLAVLRAQPACTLDQIAQLTIGNLLGQKTEFVLCNPSDEILDLFQPLLQAQLQVIASTIPDSVNLTPSAANTENPLNALRAARTFMRFSPSLPLGLLVLIAVFAVRSLRDWLNWWGIPILTSGLFGLILAAAVAPLSQWGFTSYVTPRLPNFLPASVTETIRDLLSAALSGVTAPIIFQSISLVLIGMIMILATRFKKPAQT